MIALFLIFIALSCAPLNGAIQELHSFADFPQEQESTTLACFDLDFTVFMPQEDILWDKRLELREFIFNLLHAFDPNKAYALWQSRTMICVEDMIPELIRHLQEQCAVIGVTSRSSGYSPAFDDYIEESTYSDLLNLGIDFSTTDNSFEIFEDLNHPQPDRLVYPFQTICSQATPLFTHGIFFCGSIAKGEMVRRYLMQHPEITAIILIDDSYQHLISLEGLCSELGLEFMGYHYTRAHKEPIKEHVIDLAQRFADEIKQIISC